MRNLDDFQTNKNDYEQQKRLEILCICWLLFVIILEKIDFLLNSFIFIDMYYTLKNPFEPQRNRNLIFSFLSMLAIFSIFAYYVLNFTINDFD